MIQKSAAQKRNINDTDTLPGQSQQTQQRHSKPKRDNNLRAICFKKSKNLDSDQWGNLLIFPKNPRKRTSNNKSAQSSKQIRNNRF